MREVWINAFNVNKEIYTYGQSDQPTLVVATLP